MQHTRVAVYGVQAGSVDEVTKRAEEGLLPIFRTAPGFVSYGVAKVADDELVSISIWDSRDEAEAATGLAADWVGENIADLVERKQNYIGDLAFYATVPGPAGAGA